MANIDPTLLDEIPERRILAVCKHMLVRKGAFETPADRWTPVASWFGITLESITLRVTVNGDGEVWFRREGFGRTPPSVGKLVGSQVFHIGRGDLSARISILPVGGKVTVKIDSIG